MDAIDPLDVRKSAEAHFASGLLCAESVVLALADANGIASGLLPKAATAFCSGMSRTCGTCGALTGAVLGLSVVLGRSNADESVQSSYTAAQQLIDAFENEFGSRDCHHLLDGCDLGTPEGQAVFKERNLRLRCLGFTGKAAEIAAGILVGNHGSAIPA